MTQSRGSGCAHFPNMNTVKGKTVVRVIGGVVVAVLGGVAVVKSIMVGGK